MLRPAGSEGVRNPTPAASPGAVSDAELGLRARSGDREAFAGIYERYARLVHGVLLAHVPLADVHDLVQDVFVLALRSIAELDEPARIGPWLVTIARHRAHDHHKRGRRETELDHAPEPATTAPQDDGGSDESELVLATIRALPESYRETLVLRLVEGLSGPEIAERTGLTHGSVRVNLFRGMKLLREKLERDARKSTS
ncbi:MAG: sigma-70 family RNA polymerase sigma factor [Planctomycetes bacterium]|nr:sigma-70 family RNA polymerase sigma factor [Planctomycetota bacterium]